MLTLLNLASSLTRHMGVFSFVFAKVILVVFALLAEVMPFSCVSICCCSCCFWWPGVTAISPSFAVTPSRGDAIPSCTQEQKCFSLCVCFEHKNKICYKVVQIWPGLICVNKPHCAAAVRPSESEATTSTFPPARVRTCSVLSGSC